MNPELAQLKDIHLPDSIPGWLIAPGWIAIYILLFGIVCYVLYVWFKRQRKKYIIKFALKKLKNLESLLSENPEGINVAAEISVLLRRTALHYFRREEVAGLTGKHWLDFLNRSSETDKFSQDTSRILIEMPYQKNITTDLVPLFTLARTWLMAISKMSSRARRRPAARTRDPGIKTMIEPEK